MQKKGFVNWVNSEVAKRLDDKPFSSLPLKTRIGIFLLLIAFIVGYGLSGLLVILGINKKPSSGVLGVFLYALSWIIGFVGISLAGRDCIKYPIYFFAKFLKKLFPYFFEEENMENDLTKKSNLPSIYVIVTFVTILLIGVLIIIYIFFFKNVLIFVGIGSVFIIHQILYIYGMFSTKTNFFFPTIKGKELFKNNKNFVIFRFDDGPDPVYTEKILDILKRENLKAIFAITAKNAEKYPEIVKRIHDEGHIIANHTYSHPFNILLMSYKDVYEEIKKANDILYSITGTTPKFFCPTIGQKNPVIGRVIKELGLIPLMWDLRTIDTHLTEELIIKRIKKKLKPPSIILFHDGTTSLTSKKNRDSAINALIETINLIKENKINIYNGVELRL
ncbi:MAG: polysaccharide deacetylase family protein [Brevinematales bacterium]